MILPLRRRFNGNTSELIHFLVVTAKSDSDLMIGVWLKFMMLKVSRYVTLSHTCACRSVYLSLRVCLPERARCCHDVCVVTSFDVHMS